MSRFLLPLLTWLAFPIYIWQGIGVRMRTQRLTPANGPISGTFDGTGPAINLLMLGDSSAAGVGVDRTEDSLGPQLARHLHEHTGREVNWRMAGFSSAVSKEIRDLVIPNLERGGWTHIVLSIGTNDCKNFHTVPAFKRNFGGMLYALKAKWPEARVVWSPVVEFTSVPAIPTALGKILEIRAQAFNRLGKRLCAERSAICATRLPIRDPQTGFCHDGFHASAAGFNYWAQHLVGYTLGDE